MSKTLDDFELSYIGGINPFRGMEVSVVLAEAYALLSLVSAAHEDAELVQNNRDAFDAAGRPDQWPAKVLKYVPDSALTEQSGRMKARAFDGVNTLIALAAYLADEEVDALRARAKAATGDTQ